MKEENLTKQIVSLKQDLERANTRAQQAESTVSPIQESSATSNLSDVIAGDYQLKYEEAYANLIQAEEHIYKIEHNIKVLESRIADEAEDYQERIWRLEHNTQENSH